LQARKDAQLKKQLREIEEREKREERERRQEEKQQAELQRQQVEMEQRQTEKAQRKAEIEQERENIEKEKTEKGKLTYAEKKYQKEMENWLVEVSLCCSLFSFEIWALRFPVYFFTARKSESQSR